MLTLKTEHINHLIIISTALIMRFSAFTNLIRIIQSKWVEKLWTSEIGTTSEQRTRGPFPKCPLFGGLTVLRNCRDKAKLACHCTAHYKIEWVYIRTKVSGPDSFEVASPGNEKERKKEERNEKERKKKERLTNGLFFEHLVLTSGLELTFDNQTIPLKYSIWQFKNYFVQT